MYGAVKLFKLARMGFMGLKCTINDSVTSIPEQAPALYIVSVPAKPCRFCSAVRW